MPLITVYFDTPINDEIPYTKAIIDDQALPFFEGLGAATTPMSYVEDPPDKDGDADDPPDFDPDKGFGEPGSEQWHETQLAGMKTKKAVIAYVGPEFTPPKRLSLPKLKAAALKALLEDKDDGDS